MEVTEAMDDWPSQAFRDSWIEKLKIELIKNYDPTLPPPQNPKITEAQVFEICPTKASYVMTMEGVIQNVATTLPPADKPVVTPVIPTPLKLFSTPPYPSSGPTGSLLTEEQPVSKLFARAIYDPASLKLLTILSSVLIIFVFFQWSPVDATPLKVVNVIALIYSIFSLGVTSNKKEDIVAKAAILKKLFGGRVLDWHEIHSSICMAILVGNIASVHLIFQSSVFPALCIATNILIFGFEWYQSAKKLRSFTTETCDLECQCQIKKWILTFFHKFPRIFNFIRVSSVIASMVLVGVLYGALSNVGLSYVFANSLLIITTVVLTLTQMCKKLQNKLTTKVIKKEKFHTYLSIAVTVISGVLLHLSSITGITRYLSYQSYYNYGYHSYGYNRYESFPVACPISFGLNVFVFVVSFLDLYSQAIFHRTTSTGSTYQPLAVEVDKKRSQNLPVVIENPFFVDENGKLPEK